MINVAIIGCGKIAQVRHIPEYLARQDVRLYGLYDMNQERCEELAEKYGAIAFSSVEELLADKNIDAVSICAANNAHSSLSIDALENGKDVLCEKPMAVTEEECEAMVKSAEKTGHLLMIGQNQRLTPAHKKAHDLIASNSLGSVISFETTFGHGGPETWSVDPGKNTWFFDKKIAAMGAMADLGIHKTDLICYLLGDSVKEVSAELSTLDKRDANGNLIGVDDNAICIYRMTKGAIGTMRSSWTFYGKEDNSTVIYLTGGIISIYRDPEHSVVVDYADGRREVFDTDQIQTNDNQTSSGVIDEFIEAIHRGKKTELDAKSVLPAMKAVFAAIRSSESGKREVVK